MSYWSEAPLVRLLPPFIGGIIYSLCFETAFNYELAGVITTIVLLWLVLYATKQNYSKRWFFGVIAYLVLFFIGWHITNIHNEIRQDNHFSKNLTNNDILIVYINEQPHEKAHSIKAITEVKALVENNKQIPVKGRLIVYLPKDSSTKKLQYGDCLLINAKIDTIQGPLNPYEFNYKQYLSFRNIYHQSFVKNEQWIKLSANHGWWLYHWAYNLRDKLLAIFQQHLSGNEYTVAASLIAGYVDDIDRDLITAYANTGVLHVLSVSGMHVAIIYIAISRLLAFADRKRAAMIIKNTVVIAFLWFYACITGFSPAVLRATFMLSLVITGKILNRESNIYNTLAASALLLLFGNPYLITDIGFQLSYLSLVGIVALQPGIYNLLTPKNRLTDYIWELTSTSIAAQIIVLPLILFYFQRFPNYFIPANLVVIPLSTVAIYSGIMLLLLNPVPILGTVLGKLTWLSVKALNYCVFFFNTLPMAVLSGLYINLIQTLLLYLAIAFLFGFFINKRYAYILTAVILFITTLVIHDYQSFQNNKQQKIIVYSIAKTTAVDFISGNKSNLISNEIKSITDKDYIFHIAGNHSHTGISKNMFSPLHDSATVWGNKHMVFIKTNAVKQFSTPVMRINADYILLSDNPNVKIADLTRVFNCKAIVADGSNKHYHCKKWEEECKKLHLVWHDVTTKGAFLTDTGN